MLPKDSDSSLAGSKMSTQLNQTNSSILSDAGNSNTDISKDSVEGNETKLETPVGPKAESSTIGLQPQDGNERGVDVLQSISEGYVKLLRNHLKDVETKLGALVHKPE